MEVRWTAGLRAALPVAAGLLLSGCYVSTEYGKYPEGKIVQTASLVREWTAQDVELALSQNGAFSAAGLTLSYFQCPVDDVVREKSGSGTWHTLDDGESTDVLIEFEDGCSATLWAGESEGKTVLWATQGDEDEVLILRS
ncbi:hypothetical protein [Streptomyces blattellae]|uniref:hypothetical protein n=1 Tax=Streptomyces blattellae TaxID=2569855 RepID=UPI0012BA10B9|nr:hypothetical protein [Streptomyces blattellae]